MEDPRALTARDFAGQVAGRDPRAALMWPPEARDVARVAAAVRAAAGGAPAPRVLDAGAGSGLLARLLADAGLRVTAVDAGDEGFAARRVGRFHGVERARVEDVPVDDFDAAVVSWMEAGRDYRAAVARRAPVVVQARDAGGGCGVTGDTSFAPHGLRLAVEWVTPSWEDVAHAWRTRGRGPGGAGLPRAEGHGNVVEVWVGEKVDARAVARAVEAARGGAPLPWEPELEALGVLSSRRRTRSS